MDDNRRDERIPEDSTEGAPGRQVDPDERSLRAALDAAVSRGAGEDELAGIVASSPFIERLVWQFTVRKWAGPLYKHYDQVLEDWRGDTRGIVWTNARANGGRLVRESLKAKNFGAYWNGVVRCKSLTARARVLRDFYPSGDTGREFTDVPGPAGDDPSHEAELNERRLRLDEASRHLPTNLDRLIFRHLMDGTYDARMIADSAGCCTRTVRHAAARVLTWVRGILEIE